MIKVKNHHRAAIIRVENALKKDGFNEKYIEFLGKCLGLTLAACESSSPSTTNSSSSSKTSSSESLLSSSTEKLMLKSLFQKQTM